MNRAALFANAVCAGFASVISPAEVVRILVADRDDLPRCGVLVRGVSGRRLVRWTADPGEDEHIRDDVR